MQVIAMACELTCQEQRLSLYQLQVSREEGTPGHSSAAELAAGCVQG